MSSNSKCGDVACFIQDHLKFSAVSLYNLEVDCCEDLWLEVTLSNGKTLVLEVIYRHPGYQVKEFEEKLLNTVKLLNERDKRFVFGGDININLLKNSRCVTSYQDSLLSLGCSEEIEVPTRLSNDFSSGSLLDHIYTNLPKSEICSKVILEDITDHLPLLVSLQKVKPRKLPKQNFLTQDFRNFNSENFLVELYSKLSNKILHIYIII